jgi:Fur family transcriptional regulator, ferric uptake regulator
MPTSVDSEWARHALGILGEAGHRRGGARTAVVEALSRHDCAVTALELEEELRRGKASVGRASIYRALERLEELRLVQRFEAERGIASYERIDPNGHHHHHAICRRCGKLEPFEDRGLEQAIEQVSEQVPFEIAEHDVVLRGLCERCAN